MSIPKLLTDNPYRVLGVYSNSPKRDILSNLNKAKAFVRVGRPVTYEIDLPQLITACKRDQTTIDQALAALELPVDRLRHSMFWFMNATQFDKIALNHLSSGNLAQAREIWSRQENVSSLLNRMACAVIESHATVLAVNADKLFCNHAAEYCSTIDETLKLSPRELIEIFLDAVKKDGTINIENLVNVPGTSSTWKQVLEQSLVQPLIDQITSDINDAKAASGSVANYNAGIKLMNSTKAPLAKLKRLLGASNMSYQMIADKLAQTILQCGINYFNDSDDDDAPQKASTLQDYALSIAVGQLVKQRCQENVNILKRIGPEYAVRKELNALERVLTNFRNKGKKVQPKYSGPFSFSPFDEDEIGVGELDPLGRCRHLPSSKYNYTDIDTFLSQCRPLLVAIKSKLAVGSDIHIKVSSAVASAAINAVVDIINKSQERVSSIGIGLYNLKDSVNQALAVMDNIGQIAMDSQCRSYYNQNKAALVNLHAQLNPKPVAPTHSGGSSGGSSGGCYIATMVYGDYDHPQVMVLRNFRDTFLSKRNWGREFIKFYYKHSPGWVEKLKNHKNINRTIKVVLDAFVNFWKKHEDNE